MSKLEQLEELHIGENRIKDISPLKELVKLYYLGMGSNNISDITPLSGLTKLERLYANDNQISDISVLAKLPILKRALYLHNNQISEISALVENTGISGEITLNNNPLSNTALSTHIPSLKTRGITVNSDEPPADIVTFKDANLEKAIRDALGIPTELLKKEDLEQLTELKYYGKEGARISDLTGIEHCINLTKLEIPYNRITDINPLVNLTNLTWLFLDDSQIEDISGLSNLTKLETLFLHSLSPKISNISFVSNMTDLTDLRLVSNQISDISPLNNLTNLTTLALSRNQIRDISVISKLTSIKELWLHGNEIIDVSAVGNLPNLTTLELQNNRISDIIPLFENTGISGTINLTNNPLSNTALSTHIPALIEKGITVEYDEQSTDMIKISDSIFEAVIRQTIDIPTDLLTSANTGSLINLNLTGEGIVDLDVDVLKSLQGLEFINLTNNPLSANAVLVQIPELESAGITVDLGTFAADNVELTVENTSIPASLAATTEITVTITDVNGNKIKRETVDLTVDQGTIYTPAVNNGDGTYSTTYWASDTVGSAQILAIASNGKYSSISIQLTETLVSKDRSTLEINDAKPKAGEPVPVFITLLSENNLPVSGKPVSLAVAPTDGVTINQTITTTNVEGKITVTFTSDVSGSKIITASSGEVELDSSLAVIFKPRIDPSWLATMTATSNNLDIQPQTLQFGMASEATDNYDDGLDSAAPPAPHPPIGLDVYFSGSQGFFHRLLADFRTDSPSAKYDFRVRADQHDFTLSWDLSQLPAEFSWIQLRQISPVSGGIIELTSQQSAIFSAMDQTYYQFELVLGQNTAINLSAGWNMISIPGIPLETDPTQLQTADQSLILPLYRWNPATFSYEAVTKLKFGEGYWALTIKAEGTTLQIPVARASSYQQSIKAGWNMIGSVSEVADFSNPVEEPDNSIIGGTLYGWNPTAFTYQSQLEINPGQGCWVLTMVDCQLTVTAGGVLATPSAMVRTAELILPILLRSNQSSKQLVIGMDQEANTDLDRFDKLMPPVSPMKTEIEAYFERNPLNWGLQSDIQPLQDRVEWRLIIRTEEATNLSVDISTLPESYQLIVATGTDQYEMDSKSRITLKGGEVVLRLQPKRIVPEATALLQNYPNPFNPETWIPYQLNQASEVSLSVYSSDGKRVRQIDLGLKAAGNYQRTERAIYWDGRNASGESMSSGVYFYRLQAGDYSQTRKMVILK